MAMDAQTIVDYVASLDEATALAIVQSILQSRPELAPPLVTFAVPDLTYPPSKALTERRSKGYIKQLDAVKGFGFIVCDELKEVFQCDAFLHIKQASDLTAGEYVSFAVMLNKDNKPQAYDVMRDDPYGKGKGSWGKAADGGKGGDDAFGKGGDGKGGDGKGKGKSMVSEELGQFEGTIKSFNDKNGYGFIECPDLKSLGYMKDVFLHQKALGAFQVGDTVLMTIYTHHGQPQAKDLMPSASGAGPAKVAKTEEWSAGAGAAW